MKKTKSTSGERRADRRRLQEKFSDRINTFRVSSNNNSLGKRYTSPTSDNTNQNSNIVNSNNNKEVESPNCFPFIDPTIPLQQASLYDHTQSQLQEQALLYQLIDMAPTGSFVPLPTSNHSNNNHGFSIQTVPNSYSENSLTGFQDQTINNHHGVIDNQLQMNFLTNLAAFNQTVPANIHHNPHHGLSHYSSDSSLAIHNESLINTYGQHHFTPNHHSNSHIGSMQDIVPPSLQPRTLSSTEMPSRPSPPSLPGGPEYFQASENFRLCFRRVDSDDNGFITLEELRAFLENKDGSNFNDEAVLTIMDMFDNSRT